MSNQLPFCKLKEMKNKPSRTDIENALHLAENPEAEIDEDNPDEIPENCEKRVAKEKEVSKGDSPVEEAAASASSSSSSESEDSSSSKKAPQKGKGKAKAKPKAKAKVSEVKPDAASSSSTGVKKRPPVPLDTSNLYGIGFFWYYFSVIVRFPFE